MNSRAVHSAASAASLQRLHSTALPLRGARFSGRLEAGVLAAQDRLAGGNQLV